MKAREGRGNRKEAVENRREEKSRAKGIERGKREAEKRGERRRGRQK